jgi:AraC-like DNA-binding protein
MQPEYINQHLPDRAFHIVETADADKKRLYHLRTLYRNRLAEKRRTDIKWRYIELRPHLWVSMVTSPPNHQVITMGYCKQPAMIDFGFVLSGRLNHRLHGGITDDRIEADDGMAGIGFFPNREGVVEVGGDRTVRLLHIHISPERLYEMVREDLGAMPTGFRGVLEGRNVKDYVFKDGIDPAARLIALDIINGRPDRLPKKLYLECKALELITLQLGCLMSGEADRRVHIRLNRNEKDRIRAAGDWLVRDLSAPPSLADLSGRFCLSLNKLQQGFHEVYGRSVFGYLREHKMQKARFLLESAEMNVSQVAWEVGYVNVSQFTKAYKKRFGILPKHYRQSVLAR